ncbi:glycosyltransferase [Vibrio parahaemolyticus]|uniref:glycosyltransferase n=1 Tax=Vibrio parahaemolyticus TaxID=670 RepID=UPI001FAD9EA1|nr:glycosyltransferase [Vibrio parahaemolyticus]MCI9702469.1 glycosyltransferase [Vibrio parahaemolyticus]
MKNKPKVSVYMPTHNRGELAIRAVKSVLSQTYENIELIVVDDGSKDCTFEMLNQIEDKRLIVLRNDSPEGACRSRNRAIKHATGKYITGLDDDDYFKQERVETLLTFFDDKYSFVCDNSISHNKGIYEFEQKLSRKVSLDDILYSNVGNQVFTLTERLKEVGLFDTGLPSSQDYDLWTRMIIKYGEALQIPKHTYVYDITHDKSRISTSSKAIEGAKIYFDRYRIKMNKGQVASHYIRFSKYGELVRFNQAALIFQERGMKELTKCYLRYVYLKSL